MVSRLRVYVYILTQCINITIKFVWVSNRMTLNYWILYIFIVDIVDKCTKYTCLVLDRNKSKCVFAGIGNYSVGFLLNHFVLPTLESPRITLLTVEIYGWKRQIWWILRNIYKIMISIIQYVPLQISINTNENLLNVRCDHNFMQ